MNGTTPWCGYYGVCSPPLPQRGGSSSHRALVAYRARRSTPMLFLGAGLLMISLGMPALWMGAFLVTQNILWCSLLALGRHLRRFPRSSLPRSESGRLESRLGRPSREVHSPRLLRHFDLRILCGRFRRTFGGVPVRRGRTCPRNKSMPSHRSKSRGPHESRRRRALWVAGKRGGSAIVVVVVVLLAGIGGLSGGPSSPNRTAPVISK